MSDIRRISKACALAAALLLVATTSASVAVAGHYGHGHRYGHGGGGYRGSHGSSFYGARYPVRYRAAYATHGYYAAPRYYSTRYPSHYYGSARYYTSSPGFAFSIGISNFPAGGYYYYDPYCGESFASLGVYYGHFHHYHHPGVINVMATHGGYPVSSFCWSGGGWTHY